MPDSDYIEPRDRTPMTAWSYTQSESDTRCLLASHAALDDVARELAEAVRFHVAMWLVNGTDAPIDGQDALARYDAMTGGKG